jgi:hypothetical protein
MPPIAPILPLRQRQANQQAANQQAANQRRRVDPRLLEEAAARQQAIADAAVTPQRTVINPDAYWLQMLPHAMQEMRSPDQFHTPITSPDITPAFTPTRKNSPDMLLETQGLWDLHNMAATTRTINFNELPTDALIVVQNQRRWPK